jgi:hypothetical protein
MAAGDGAVTPASSAPTVPRARRVRQPSGRH